MRFLVQEKQHCSEKIDILQIKFRGGITMNKTELIAAIAEKTELSKKDAEKALKALSRRSCRSSLRTVIRYSL